MPAEEGKQGLPMTAPQKEPEPIQTEKAVDEYDHPLKWNIPYCDLSPRGKKMKDGLDELKRKLKRQAGSYEF